MASRHSNVLPPRIEAEVQERAIRKWNLHVIPAVVNMAKGVIIVEEWHSKMPDDGKKQLRAAQEKNRRDSEGYLRRKRHRQEYKERAEQARSNTALDILFR